MREKIFPNPWRTATCLLAIVSASCGGGTGTDPLTRVTEASGKNDDVGNEHGNGGGSGGGGGTTGSSGGTGSGGGGGGEVTTEITETEDGQTITHTLRDEDGRIVRQDVIRDQRKDRGDGKGDDDDDDRGPDRGSDPHGGSRATDTRIGIRNLCELVHRGRNAWTGTPQHCECEPAADGQCRLTLFWRAAGALGSRFWIWENGRSGRALSSTAYEGTRRVTIPAAGATFSIEARDYNPDRLVGAIFVQPVQPHRELQGKLEAINRSDGTVSGWALDPEHPQTSLTVYVYIDGQRLFSVLANRPRADVARHFGITSSNRFGFHFTIPQLFFDGQRHTLRLKLLDPDQRRDHILQDTFQLAGQRQTTDLPAPRARLSFSGDRYVVTVYDLGSDGLARVDRQDNWVAIADIYDRVDNTTWKSEVAHSLRDGESCRTWILEFRNPGGPTSDPFELSCGKGRCAHGRCTW